MKLTSISLNNYQLEETQQTFTIHSNLSYLRYIKAIKGCLYLVFETIFDQTNSIQLSCGNKCQDNILMNINVS